MIYVVGSGPAGVACAYALVTGGHDVTMLDSGIDLEDARRVVVQDLGSKRPDDWDEGSLQLLKEPMSASHKGIPLKYAYGSDFPYRDAEKFVSIEARGVETSLSFAKGGLSNVWGAAVLPYRSSDIADWPVKVEELAPHYQAVLGFVSLAAVKDDLEAAFPLFSKAYQPLRPSRQASALMQDLEANKAALQADGYMFGYSRLAVNADPTESGLGCLYCGLCLYGCPYGFIYNAASTLQRLLGFANFQYRPNVIVRKVAEAKGEVAVLAESRLNGEKLRFTGVRAYLACGVFSTTQILLESLEAFDYPLTMRDSQYFLLPLLRYRAVDDVTQERLYTLAQLFVEIMDSDLSKQTIHLQVYTYNDLYARAMRRLSGPVYSILKMPIEQLLGRFLVIQGYLHSDESPTILLRLLAGKKNNSGTLVLEAGPNGRTEHIIKGIATSLSRHRRHFKAIPLSALLQTSQPGRGFHSGGTFPMRAKPTNFESDGLGRPYGFEKVHVVDATTFPSIPAAPITLTVLANAHRIASAYHQT
jgi:choline dehydrogenase-like flavoprotein